MTSTFIFIIILFILLVLFALYNLFLGSGSASNKIIWLFVLIFLGVGFYLIYIYFFKTQSTLVTSLYLNKTPATVIDGKTFSSPNSPYSSYGIWIYVNSWNSNSQKTIFTTTGSELSLYFDATRPSLYCSIQTGCSASASQTERILISDSFPLQKWTYVIISLNGAFIDCFLDGKLITSHKLNNSALAISCTSNNWSLNMGTGFDAYAYNLIRYTEAMSPQKAYQTFYSTAPSGNSTGLLTGSSVNLAIVTNNDNCNATTIL